MNHQHQSMQYPGLSWEVFLINPGQAWSCLANEIISQGVDPYHHLTAGALSSSPSTPTCNGIAGFALALLSARNAPSSSHPSLKILPSQDPPFAQPRWTSHTHGYTVSSDCWIFCPKVLGFLKTEVAIILYSSDSICKSKFQTE